MRKDSPKKINTIQTLHYLWAGLIIILLQGCTTTILTPSHPTVVMQGEPITLQGEVRYLGMEQEDAANEILWTSSLSGDLGQGKSITVKNLPLGLHEITATSGSSTVGVTKIYVDKTAQGCWEKISQHTITNRFHHTAFVLNEQLWVLGGIKHPDMFVYPQKDMMLDYWLSSNGVYWKQGPNEIDNNPAGAQSIVVNGKALVAGGGTSKVPYFEFISHQVIGYHEDHDYEVHGVFLPARRDSVILNFKDQLWIMAGFASVENKAKPMGWGNEKLRRDVIVSKDGERWVETSTSFAEKIPWDARQGHAGVVFKGKMWLLGGRTQAADGTYSAKNDIWTTEDGEKWEQVTPKGELWEPRAWHSAVVYKDRLYVMGGLRFIVQGAYPDDSAWGDVWATDDGIHWQELRYPAQGCSFPAVYGHTATIMNDRIYLVGGYDPSTKKFEGYIRSFRL